MFCFVRFIFNDLLEIIFILSFSQMDLLAAAESRGDVRTRFIRVWETAAVWMDLKLDMKGKRTFTYVCVCVCVDLLGSFYWAECATCGLLGIALLHSRLQCVWVMLRDSVFPAPDAGPRSSGHSGGRGYVEMGVVSERAGRWSRTPRWAESDCPAVRAAPDQLQ